MWFHTGILQVAAAHPVAVDEEDDDELDEELPRLQS